MVGTWKEPLAKVVENAVETTEKSVRDRKGFRAATSEGRVEGQKAAEHYATVRIYFDCESK